jgi:hypothetical protein
MVKEKNDQDEDFKLCFVIIQLLYCHIKRGCWRIMLIQLINVIDYDLGINCVCGQLSC